MSHTAQAVWTAVVAARSGASDADIFAIIRLFEVYGAFEQAKVLKHNSSYFMEEPSQGGTSLRPTMSKMEEDLWEQVLVVGRDAGLTDFNEHNALEKLMEKWGVSSPILHMKLMKDWINRRSDITQTPEE